MGGIIAQELALRHPTSVARLVLLATIPPTPSHVPTLDYLPLLRAMLGGELRLSQPRIGTASVYFATCSHTYRPGPAVIEEMTRQISSRPTPVHVAAQQAERIVACRGPSGSTALQCPPTSSMAPTIPSSR